MKKLLISLGHKMVKIEAFYKLENNKIILEMDSI